MKQIITIRAEKSDDIDAIHAVVHAAFQKEREAELVALIRGRAQSLLSLVALMDGELIGHVLLSPITIESESAGRFAGVAPLSVKPEFQGQGVGSQLMHAVIAEAKMLGFDALFLLGSPQYYPRFGFSPSHLDNEYQATDAFMHLELKPGSLKNITGLAKYVPAFGESGA